MNMIVNNAPNQLRSYSLKELAALYGVTPRTIKIWLEPFKNDIGEKTGRYYTIRQVQVIFSKIGEPCVIAA